MDTDFGSALDIFTGYFKKYENFVKFNPRVATEIEAIIRWSSYLIASRKSPIVAELLSSGANLLQLCNDIILRQANDQLKLELNNYVTQLKTFLSVIQSLELLAEIYARDTYSPPVKWAIISVIQITKAAIKLVLLLVFDEGLTKSQWIVPLDRLHYSEIVDLRNKVDTLQYDASQAEPKPSTSKSVVLKSSGRKMRSIKEPLPKGTRFSNATEQTSPKSPFNRLQQQRLKLLLERYRDHRSARLTDRQMYGELLHISRPLAHLALMGAFGTKSWISYFTSMAMDMSSLYLVRAPFPVPQSGDEQSLPDEFRFNLNERMELGQRASSLLLYLLRSPFFDEYTKQKALEGLSSTAESIPLVGGLLGTFINYIPDWQKDYFRTWSE